MMKKCRLHIWFGLMILQVGCISVGIHRSEVSTQAIPENDETKVILVLIDGLKHNTLKSYLARLAELDSEPPWKSGISLLAREQFKLANAQYPMAALPALRLTAEATLITGQTPIQHGLIGSKVTRFPMGGPATRFDLQASETQERFFQTYDWEQPTESAPALGPELLQASPWVSTLHQRRRIASIFTTFGVGGDWYLPRETRPLSAFLFEPMVSSQTSEILDQGVEQQTQAVIALGSSLTTLRFASVWGQSCVKPVPGCRNANKTLQQRQFEALRKTDQRLWHIFRDYQMRRPESFDKTTFIISGTVGALVRPDRAIGNPKFSVSEEKFKAELEIARDQQCNQIRAKDDIEHLYAAEFEGAYGFVRVAKGSLGQGHKIKHIRRCLLENITKLKRRLTAEDKLDALVVVDESGRNTKVDYGAALQAASGPRERRRISDKLKNLTQDTTDGQVIAAVFLKPPYVFSDSQDDTLHRANLRHEVLRFPFLLADKRLSQTARRQLEGAAIDHIDFGPTLFELLGQRKLGQPIFSRDGLLEFSEIDNSGLQSLDYVRSQRNQYGRKETTKQPLFLETAESVQVTYEEDRTTWPPDTLAFQFGDAFATWTIETEHFSTDNCTYAQNLAGRKWSCTLPKPQNSRTSNFEILRTPDLSGTGTLKESHTFYLEPTSPLVKNAFLSCDESDDVLLHLSAESENGIASIVFEEARVAGSSAHKPKLDPFRAKYFTSKMFVERFCENEWVTSPGYTCGTARGYELTSVDGALRLERMFDHLNPPERLYICSEGLECTQHSITPLPDDANCTY